MTEDPAPDRTRQSEAPAQPAEPTNPWRSNHALFVLTVLSRYRINLYRDRDVHRGEVGEGIRAWDQQDKVLAIEEGRRQLDAQFAQLQYVTSRASALLPVGIAASVFFLTALDDLDKIGPCAQVIARVLLVFGALLAIWGTLVMGALIGCRARYRRTDTLQLTNEPAGLLTYLARDYAENVATGVNTNAALLTHLGTGVTWIALGAVLGTAGVAVSMW